VADWRRQVEQYQVTGGGQEWVVREGGVGVEMVKTRTQVEGRAYASWCARYVRPGACCGRQQRHPAVDQGQSRA
jgi:hypothetical protein